MEKVYATAKKEAENLLETLRPLREESKKMNEFEALLSGSSPAMVELMKQRLLGN